ncbi:hypothetical protein MMPV_008398 [Pyropia vietnamensis]
MKRLLAKAAATATAAATASATEEETATAAAAAVAAHGCPRQRTVGGASGPNGSRRRPHGRWNDAIGLAPSIGGRTARLPVPPHLRLP